MLDNYSRVPPANLKKMPDEMLRFLAVRKHTHFVTLTTNDQQVSRAKMRALLREWDARLNRYIVGPKWQKRTDERMVWYAYIEKSHSNPHWHLLLNLLSDQIETLNEVAPLEGPSFETMVDITWRRLLPSGTTDVQLISETAENAQRVTSYVTKSLDNMSNVEDFIFYNELF